MDPFFPIDGQGILCDVTVVHPCWPENSTAHHTQVNRSHARRPGGIAAAGKEREKDRKYGANCRQKGYTFVPLRRRRSAVGVRRPSLCFAASRDAVSHHPPALQRIVRFFMRVS
mmetsp:Transcript_15882/g.37873  ORF Transcript_15882/g.37873 Transcript_15882/m.37873 type:complete len:114 (-) Transcript_15882:241-582(-)